MKPLELNMAITLRAFLGCAKNGHNKLSLKLPFVVHCTTCDWGVSVSCKGLIIAMHPTNHTESTASLLWTKNCISLAFDILQWNRFTTTCNKHQQRSASILKLRKRLASNLLTNKHPWLRYVTFVRLWKKGSSFLWISLSLWICCGSWVHGGMDGWTR